MVQINQESRLKYWATRSSIRWHRSLVHFLHPACFAHAICCAHSLARSRTSLTHSLARSLCSLSRLWESEGLDSYFLCFFSILDHSALVASERNSIIPPFFLFPSFLSFFAFFLFHRIPSSFSSLLSYTYRQRRCGHDRRCCC